MCVKRLANSYIVFSYDKFQVSLAIINFIYNSHKRLHHANKTAKLWMLLWMHFNLSLHIQELTILAKLTVALITHFGSSVLHVFQGNFVPATVSAHNLWPIRCKESFHLGNYAIESIEFVFLWVYSNYLATGMAVMPSVSEAEMDGAVHTHCYLGNGDQRWCILPETHAWLLANLKRKTAVRMICGTVYY